MAIIFGENGAPIIIVYVDNQNLTNGQLSLLNGETAIFSVTANDPEGDSLTYQWYVNGSPLPGATSTTYSFVQMPTALATYNVRVVVTDSSGNSVEATVAVTVEGGGSGGGGGSTGGTGTVTLGYSSASLVSGTALSIICISRC